MTNGDRIRQMSNEELAKFLASKSPDYSFEQIFKWLEDEHQEKMVYSEKIKPNELPF